jgi:hypothetical protein
MTPPYCQRCHRPSTSRQPSDWKHLRSLSADGRTFVCRACGSKETLRKARRVLLKTSWNITPGDSPELVRKAMSQQARIASAAGPGLGAMQAKRRQGLSAAGRDAFVIAQLVAQSRKRQKAGEGRGQFLLCVACHLLLYRPPAQRKRTAASWHQDCLSTWRQSEAFRDAARKRGNPKTPAAERELRHRLQPLPQPPARRGRRLSPEEAEERYRWTLMRFGQRKSLAAIAAEEETDRVIVHKGIAAFVALLPDRWRDVFGDEPARGVRNQGPGYNLDLLIPVERLRRGE